MSQHLIKRLRLGLRMFGEILVVAAALLVAVGPRMDELGISYIIGLLG